MLRAWERARDFHAVPIICLLGLIAPLGAAMAEMPGGATRPVSGQALQARGEVFRTEVGDRVFFAAGSASLGARARVALEAQAAWLLRHSDLEVIVEGHADDPGDENANLALAAARAETVRDRLAQLGVPEARLAISTLGRSVQVVTCPDPACAAPNRRVVLRIVGPEVAADPAPQERRPGVRPALRRLF